MPLSEVSDPLAESFSKNVNIRDHSLPRPVLHCSVDATSTQCEVFGSDLLGIIDCKLWIVLFMRFYIFRIKNALWAMLRRSFLHLFAFPSSSNFEPFWTKVGRTVSYDPGTRSSSFISKYALLFRRKHHFYCSRIAEFLASIFSFLPINLLFIGAYVFYIYRQHYKYKLSYFLSVKSLLARPQKRMMHISPLVRDTIYLFL